MKKYTPIACAICAFLAASCLQIIIPEVRTPSFGDQFEDICFAAYCLTMFDSNGDGIISVKEADAVTEIKCDNRQIKSLQGIEYFRNLQSLSCSLNSLKTLDVSRNTVLMELDCTNNQLSALDVSKNLALTILYCTNNQLTTLDITTNSSLESLACSNNQLSALDVSKNTSLRYLNCRSNQLTSLDVSNNLLLNILDYSPQTNGEITLTGWPRE